MAKKSTAKKQTSIGPPTWQTIKANIASLGAGDKKGSPLHTMSTDLLEAVAFLESSESDAEALLDKYTNIQANLSFWSLYCQQKLNAEDAAKRKEEAAADGRVRERLEEEKKVNAGVKITEARIKAEISQDAGVLSKETSIATWQFWTDFIVSLKGDHHKDIVIQQSCMERQIRETE